MSKKLVQNVLRYLFVCQFSSCAIESFVLYFMFVIYPTKWILALLCFSTYEARTKGPAIPQYPQPSQMMFFLSFGYGQGIFQSPP